MRRVAKLLICVLVIGLLLSAVLVVWFQEYFILPSLAFGLRAELLPKGVREYTISADAGVQLRVWTLEPNSAGPFFGDGMLVFHGNADSLRNSISMLRPFAEQGLRGFAMDYRGTNGNAGWPTPSLLLSDGEQLVRFAKEQLGVGRIKAIMGSSFGTGIASPLAVTHDIPYLFLVSPHLSIADVVKDRWLVTILAPFVRLNIGSKDSFPHFKSTHVVMVHGLRDRSILPRHAEALRDLYRGDGGIKLIIVPNAAHNDAFPSAINEFLSALK